MTENQTTVTDPVADVDGTADAGTAVGGADLAPESPAEAQELNRSAVQSVQVLDDPEPDTGEADTEDETDTAGEADTAGGADTGADDADADDAGAADVADEGPAGSGSRNGSRRAPAHEQLVAEGDAAGDYLERLLDILDYDGDIDLDVEGERAVVSIIGDGNDVDKLVGDHGEVLDALQELTRLAATAETGQRSRLMLDVAGYRAQRRLDLSELGSRTAREVLESGEPVRLAPMNPFERKVVHDAVADVDGVESSSEGEEPRRRVVVSPAS